MGKKLMLLVWLLIAVSGVMYAYGQMPFPQPQKSSEKYVEISIKTNKQKYICGEPIILEMRVKNITKDPLQFGAVLSPTSDVEIRIIRPEEFPWRYHGVFKVALYPRTVYKLAPQDVRTIRYVMLYDEKSPNGFLTATPGKMTLAVQMRYTINDRIPRIVTFPPLNIEIVKVHGINEEAFKLLQNKEVAKELTTGTGSKATESLYNRVVSQYPKSLFSPYCLYALSGYKLRQFRRNELTSGSVVLKLLDQIMQNYPDFPLMDYVYYRHAVFYYFQKEHKKARHWLATLYYKFPESPKIRRGDPLFKEYFPEEEVDFDVPGSRPANKNWMLR